MRAIPSVSTKEYVLQDHETVVSKTDLAGNITYVNADFVKISGFSESELLGSPQSIVRHPDMPREAFADFWATIRAGKAWTGLVKNRCKNGDYYWVEANAAPLIQDGKMVGYTSVRLKPTREQVQAAEHAYAAIRKGDKSIKILEGAVVRNNAASWLRMQWQKLSLLKKLGGFTATIALGVAMVFWSGTVGRSDLAAMLATGTVLAVLLGMWLLHNEVVIPLRRTVQDLERMSAGDLTGKIPVLGFREMAAMLQGLRVFQTNVKLLVGQIKEATDVVEAGASDIAQGNADLSAKTENQASSLQETAASMVQMTGSVKNNATAAQEATELVNCAADTAFKGGAAVSEVVQTMSSIKDSSSKIVDIIAVIDSIAFQTNILALNAAVEAARAGEQGRGFAVVATEVRNLAHRSSQAAKEIKTLIHASVERVENGASLVDSAGRTMTEIVQAVQKVAGLMGEIAAASKEQSSGIDQITLAVSHMDEITQQNSTVVESAAVAANAMQKQAEHLSELVGSFRLVNKARAQAPQLHGSAARPVRLLA